jgi:hypothetical protein
MEGWRHMRDKPYYSVRTGKHPTAGRLDLDGLERLLLATFRQFEEAGYFQQALGFVCVDAGFIAGSAGADVEAFFFRKLRKQNLWPLTDQIGQYSAEDVFDVIELLHDCVSKGVDGHYHSWNDCGWHYEAFDKQTGQNDFAASINEFLPEYDCGYQLTSSGEVVVIAPVGLADLEAAPTPPGDPENVQAYVSAAVDKFRRRGSTLEQQRDAVRDLADVLEYLRPHAKKVLNSKDEADLFMLANNFGIRHHNQHQKTDYDVPIWHSWMFYYYLATIHALTRLIEKADHTG